MSHPNDLARVHLLIDTERWDDALRALGAHIAHAPDDAEAWRLLARAHLGQGDSGSALAASRRAIALDPESDWGYRLLSLALTGASDYDKARDAAKHAVRLAPMNWQNHYQRASVDVSARAIDEETWAALRQTAGLAPDEDVGHRLTGLAALHTKKLRTAAAEFREALRLNPQSAEAMNDLGVVQSRRGNYPSATTSFMSALRTAPTDPHYIDNLRRMVRMWVGLIAFVHVGVRPDDLVHRCRCRPRTRPPDTTRAGYRTPSGSFHSRGGGPR